MTGAAMPDPARFARRNITLLERHGVDRALAGMIVGVACESAAKACHTDLRLPGTWLHEVALIAAEEVARALRAEAIRSATHTDGGTTEWPAKP